MQTRHHERWQLDRSRDHLDATLRSAPGGHSGGPGGRDCRNAHEPCAGTGGARGEQRGPCGDRDGAVRSPGDVAATWAPWGPRPSPRAPRLLQPVPSDLLFSQISPRFHLLTRTSGFGSRNVRAAATDRNSRSWGKLLSRWNAGPWEALRALLFPGNGGCPSGGVRAEAHAAGETHAPPLPGGTSSWRRPHTPRRAGRLPRTDPHGLPGAAGGDRRGQMCREATFRTHSRNGRARGRLEAHPSPLARHTDTRLRSFALSLL